jgi:hypothetical protein
LIRIRSTEVLKVNQVTYRYDAGTTKDTDRRIFEFLARAMPKKY